MDKHKWVGHMSTAIAEINDKARAKNQRMERDDLHYPKFEAPFAARIRASKILQNLQQRKGEWK